jgi:hypothetical protein
MKRKTGKTENPFLSEAEDHWLGEVVRKAMSHRPSAPSGSACPDPAIIRKLAFQEKIDPPTAKAALLHMAECFECAQLATNCVKEYRDLQKTKRAVN